MLIKIRSLAGLIIGVDSGTLNPVTIDGGFPISGKEVGSIGILYPGERVDVVLDVHEVSRLYITLDSEYIFLPHPRPQLISLTLVRNFKYSNSALRPSQSFPLFSDSMVDPQETLLSMPSSLPSTTYFDLSNASPPPNPTSSFAHPETAQQTILLYTRTEKLAKFSNHPKGFINRTSFSPQTPPLITLPRALWDSNQLVPYIPILSSPIWVDIIINNLDDGSHPFHLHGYSFYVLASYRSEHGWGSYSPYAEKGNAALKPQLNLKNPIKKDTVMVPRRGYVVLRFLADNPGIWMLHCHVLFHQGSGMAMGLVVGKDEEHAVIDERGKELCV